MKLGAAAAAAAAASFVVQVAPRSDRDHVSITVH